MIKRAFVTVGLAWGDEAKGATVEYLAKTKKIDLVVRYSGGPQAAHHVHLPDGRSHCFSQFGAGTFSGARTHLAEDMLIEPFALVKEAQALKAKGIDAPLDRLSISPNCLVITPWHWMMNQARELLRGDNRHGSCGMGVGEARNHALLSDQGVRLRDIGSVKLREKLSYIKALFVEEISDAVLPSHGSDLHSLRDRMASENVDDLCSFYQQSVGSIHREWSAQALDRSGDVIFEGAQGVLLDESAGFAPHNSWTNTTTYNALRILHGLNYETKVIGCLRAYLTRHGAGPFPSENPALRFEDDNTTHPWQGALRFGHFDGVLARYAIEACGGVDMLALSHLDHVTETAGYFNFVDRYLYLLSRLHQNRTTTEFLQSTETIVAAVPNDAPSILAAIERMTGVTVGITSYGKTHKQRSQLVRL